LYWRTEDQIVIAFVDTFRRIFTYDSSWANKDLNIISLGTGSVPVVYESYFEDNEQYPLLAVMGNGGTYTHQSFNNLIQVVKDDGIVLGSRALEYIELNANAPVGIQLPQASFGSQVLRGLQMGLAYSGLRASGDDISMSLISNFTTSGSIVASGSILGTDNPTYRTYHGEFGYPYPTLLNQDYWIMLSVPSSSSYYIGIDPTVSSLYQYVDSFGNTQIGTGSIVGAAILPAFLRFGTSYEGSVIIRCSSKNTSGLARQLSSLVSMYTELLKQSQITRQSTGIDLTQLVFDQSGVLNEWLLKGIRIKSVGSSGVGSNIRARGDHDRIFYSDVTVGIYGEWFQDYPIDTATGINVTILSQWRY
jgi:hypothetical protein